MRREKVSISIYTGNPGQKWLKLPSESYVLYGKDLGLTKLKLNGKRFLQMWLLWGYKLFRMQNFELKFIWFLIGLRSILFRPTFVSFWPIGIYMYLLHFFKFATLTESFIRGNNRPYPPHVKIMISPPFFFYRKALLYTTFLL